MEYSVTDFVNWFFIRKKTEKLESFHIMHVINVDLLKGTQGGLKFILSDTAIVFFPATQQHRDIKTHGLSYEDEYRGNAVAGIVTPERVEIRFHSAYSDDRIRRIWSHVLAIPEIAKASLGQLHYQGRKIHNIMEKHND